MTTRLRKVSCQDCGYTVRMTRSWLLKGLPTCPCGNEMMPAEASDLAYIGIITDQDVPGPIWTQICRENGWEDSVIRRGGAARSFQHRYEESGGLMARRAGAAHCAYAGCGRWVKDEADRCSAGHPQHENAPELEMAF